MRHVLPVAVLICVIGCSEPPVAPANDRGTGGLPNVAASVTITTRNLTLYADSSMLMKATVIDGAGRPVLHRISWRSANRAMLHVDSNGVVTGRLRGNVMVRATVDGVTDSTWVAVIVPAGALP